MKTLTPEQFLKETRGITKTTSRGTEKAFPAEFMLSMMQEYSVFCKYGKVLGSTVIDNNTGTMAICDEDLLEDPNWILASFKELKF